MVPGSNHNVATKHIVDYVFTKFSSRQGLAKKKYTCSKVVQFSDFCDLKSLQNFRTKLQNYFAFMWLIESYWDIHVKNLDLKPKIIS
jgi:hypothetical protein